MIEKIYGITKNTLTCQLHRYEVDNILNDSVPVVTVKWLEKYCGKNTFREGCISPTALLLAVKKEVERK